MTTILHLENYKADDLLSLAGFTQTQIKKDKQGKIRYLEYKKDNTIRVELEYDIFDEDYKTKIIQSINRAIDEDDYEIRLILGSDLVKVLAMKLKELEGTENKLYGTSLGGNDD